MLKIFGLEMNVSTQPMISPNSKSLYSASRYSKLLREQMMILDEGKDLELLRVGLKHMPHLTRVSVLDKFTSHVDYSPFLWNEFELKWYKELSAKLCYGIASPIRWSKADRRGHDRLTALDGWDFRGVHNLLTATKEHAPRVHQLHIGCQYSNLTTVICSRTGSAEALSAIVPKLTSFKLDCRLPQMISDSEARDHANSITSILKAAKYLQTLMITLDQHIDWSDTFPTATWPHLKVLDLGDGALSSEVLRAVAKKHSSSLRELRLRNVHLSGHSTWEEVATELGRCLQLHFITLLSMSEDAAFANTGDPYLTDDQTLRAAFEFMHRISKDLLRRRVRERGGVMLWHIDDFQPTFDLDSVIYYGEYY